MASLLYRDDADAVRQRLTTWWHGGDIGRPVMFVGARREKPFPVPPAMPEPPGWVTGYSTTNFDYRVNQAARACADAVCLGESLPAVSPDLAPNCLALFLGCRGVEMPGTVWCEPSMASPEAARFEYDPDNFYWQFSQRLGREMLRLGRGKYLIQFPDFIEGLDTLAAMRGTDQLLFDLMERPEWVQQCLRRITDLYFRYYDVMYNMFRDEVGGSVFWVWGPGRTVKLQCDFSAMIGPKMFGEFMVPVLREMSERMGYTLYHWDGPGAIPHHDHLLSIPTIQVLQWTPGAGTEDCFNPRWWPLYHKTIDAGKGVFIGSGDFDGLMRMKKEFGPKLKRFLIGYWAGGLSVKDAQKVIDAVTF